MPMKNNFPTLTRSEFLRVLGLSSLGLFLPTYMSPRVSGKKEDSTFGDAFIEKLLAESLVIDGTANLGIKRGKGLSPMIPGELKRLTGINIGGHTTRVARIDRMNDLVKSHPDALMRIDKASDIEKARNENKYGIVFYAQSEADLQGSIEPLAKWKEEGLRIFQITYRDNELGGGSSSDDLPLTSLGKHVVKELNRLKMVVDVSHCGKRTTLDVCDASSEPVTANHACVEKLTNHSRNKSDEELKAVAQTGGVVGLTTINRFFLINPSRPATLNDFVAHLDYMVETIGIDHVGLSSDSQMDGEHRYEVDYSDGTLCSYARWKHVAQKLKSMGYSREDLQKVLGLNFKRVYDQVLDP